MCTLQTVVMLCFIFDEESFSKMFLSVGARVIRLKLTLDVHRMRGAGILWRSLVVGRAVASARRALSDDH